MTNSFLIELFPLLLSDYYPDGSPVTNTNTMNIIFPFFVTNSNHQIVVKQRNNTGLKDIPDYTLEFRIGIYRTMTELITMVNETFAAIQGTHDRNNTELHGLNMAQSKIILNPSSTSSIAFTCSISNKLTQTTMKWYCRTQKATTKILGLTLMETNAILLNVKRSLTQKAMKRGRSLYAKTPPQQHRNPSREHHGMPFWDSHKQAILYKASKNRPRVNW